MDRRGFLKALTAALVVPVIPGAVLAAAEPQGQLWIKWWQKVHPDSEWEMIDYVIEGEFRDDLPTVLSGGGSKLCVMQIEKTGQYLCSLISIPGLNENSRLAMLSVSKIIPTPDQRKLIKNEMAPMFGYQVAKSGVLS
jgi:hypothetical protein